MPEETIDEKLKRLESDLAAAKHNVAQLILWVESHILAGESVDTHKTRADRHFLRSKIDD